MEGGETCWLIGKGKIEAAEGKQIMRTKVVGAEFASLLSCFPVDSSSAC